MMIDGILDAITTRFTNAVDFIFDPIWAWYGMFFGLFIVVLIIAYFVPFKWVRAGLGAVLVVAGAFVLGGRTMHNEMKDKLDEVRKRERALEAEKKKEKGGGWSW